MSEEKEYIKDDQIAEKTRELLERLPRSVKPEEVVCMMGIIVSKSPDNPTDDNGNPMAAVQQFSIGSEEDVRRMMLLLIENSFETVVDEDEDNKERIH
jgi:hypothetical protein